MVGNRKKNEQNLGLDPLERLTANLQSELDFLSLHMLRGVFFSLPFLFFLPPATRMCHWCILQPTSDNKLHTIAAILGKHLNISLCGWRKWVLSLHS